MLVDEIGQLKEERTTIQAKNTALNRLLETATTEAAASREYARGLLERFARQQECAGLLLDASAFEASRLHAQRDADEGEEASLSLRLQDSSDETCGANERLIRLEEEQEQDKVLWTIDVEHLHDEMKVRA